MYVDKGLSPETAEQVARELTEHDALRAHADIEFGIDPDNLTNPWHAAWASMTAFTIGALLPLLIVAFVPTGARIVVTVLSVVAALALTGFVSARIGYSPRLPAVVRNIAGGLLAMGVTYLDRHARGHPARLIRALSCVRVPRCRPGPGTSRRGGRDGPRDSWR